MAEKARAETLCIAKIRNLFVKKIIFFQKGTIVRN
jgi:hypothetical protein